MEKAPSLLLSPASVFSGSPGSWLGWHTGQHPGKLPDGGLILWIPQYHLGSFFLPITSPPHLLSKITVGPQPGEEIPTMSPLFESCPMFWFSFWPYHAFYGPHFLNYQETEINLNTYSWVRSVNKYQVYPRLRYTHYFRCPRDSMEHTKVLAITEYLLQAGVKNTHMTKFKRSFRTLISVMEMIKLGHMEESQWEDALARRAGDSIIFLHLSSMSPPLLFVLEDLFYSSCSHTILTSPSIWPKMTILSLFSRWFSTSNQWRPVILPGSLLLKSI